MDNFTAVKSLCTAIASAFNPDADVINFALFNEGINPQDAATPKDQAIFRIAASLVRGFVESSRSEGGVSIGVMGEEAIKQSLIFWCGYYGLDAAEVIDDFLRVIDNGSNLW